MQPKLRVAKARTTRRESPPDRFLRAPGFKAFVSREPLRIPVSPGSVGTLARLDDGLTKPDYVPDSRRRALSPPPDREDAGPSGIVSTCCAQASREDGVASSVSNKGQKDRSLLN